MGTTRRGEAMPDVWEGTVEFSPPAAVPNTDRNLGSELSSTPVSSPRRGKAGLFT